MSHNGLAAKRFTLKPHPSKYYGRISRTNWAIKCWFRSTLTPHSFQKWGWEGWEYFWSVQWLTEFYLQKKIDKRGRKLVDYDSQRHSFQNLQANAAKRKDDVKLTKGRENLEEAKRTYEMLNTELHDELPALYDSRILFLVTNLQTLYASEQMFHNETSKIYAELEAIVDKLATESQRGSYTLKKLNCKWISSWHRPEIDRKFSFQQLQITSKRWKLSTSATRLIIHQSQMATQQPETVVRISIHYHLLFLCFIKKKLKNSFFFISRKLFICFFFIFSVFVVSFWP